MAIRFLTSQNIQAGTLTVSTIANLTTASNLFLVSDSGLVKYRTAAQVRSDIGAGTGSGSVTSVAVTNGTGISASVANATTTPNITITNSDRGSSQAIFKNFAVSGQSTVVADSNNDTLTLVAGSNVTITTNATTDTITIASSYVNTNNYPTSLGWDTTTGILTLGRNGLSALTVDLDGRYPENNGTGASGTWAINITGNSATATTLQTTRSISLGTAVTSTATNFNGSSNITIPITGVKEAYLNWGGRNLSGSYAPIDAALMPDLGANRLAFTAASAVIVEYSQDGGTTWLNYAVPDSTKINLLNGNSSSIQVGGGGYPAGTNYTNYLVRLTINTSGQIYTTLNKFIVLVSTNGSSGSYCTIDARTQTNYLAGNNTWTTFSNKTPVAGWSGYNVINTSGLTTFGNTPATQYGQVRFTFGQTGYSTTYTGLLILKILGFGGVGWQTPSTLAASGNIYTYDYLKNVSFPATVSAVTFSGALSGNSTTATTLQTARNINGTSFNGSANITTANWGTARTITIGNTGKSVNGSANVSWSLAEIGAYAATNPSGYTSNMGTVTGVTGTAPIVSSGGTAPAISITAATTGAAGSMSAADKTKLDGIASGANAYVLPAATTTALGGIKLEDATVQTIAANTVSATTSRTYGLQVNSAGQGVINVPWTDNNTTNLTYTSAATTGTVNSSTGTNATIPAATTALAGLLTGANKTKLDGIAAGAQVNVATNLGITAGTTAGPIVTSSTGTNATLPTASATASGVVTTGAQTWAGTKTFSSTIAGSINGNAATATALQTARTINGTSFNGSANITTANWGTARTITIGNTGKSVNGSGNVSWTLAEIGAYAATNPSGYTSNVGTVTSIVAGTGLSGGTIS